MKVLKFYLIAILFIYSNLYLSGQYKPLNNPEHPRVVNIINFIRLCEPRDETITEQILYETVVSQVEILKRYNLRGTFLLQYDALLDSRYQKLFKNLPANSFEIGAWWEIPQPLVEDAGLIWRGRYPWDWHADVGFSTGYSPVDREKLVDVYMKEFKRIFGYYPKSVGSWFIDEHTLNYMFEKYGIVASCNCKDQVGTDGYTLWGGYYNQAYYPSLVNSYMPAQNENKQIPVPIFRMLGSDPILQYDNGLGTKIQSVTSLEPVYKNSGADSAWVKWYFKEFVEGECLEYAYVQVGQENSFTWEKMKNGYEMQMPLIAKLMNEQKILIETLSESGTWFRKHYKVTPATSLTANKVINGIDTKTVWFNNRFFRVNFLWENNSLRIRDIHIFNEDLPSDYLTKRVTSDKCTFFTLPFIDGYNWSSVDKTAGLRFKVIIDGVENSLSGEDPIINKPSEGHLSISWPLKYDNDTLNIDLGEKQIIMKLTGNDPINWFLDFTSSDNINLPFKNISSSRIDCEFKSMDYSVSTFKGSFSEPGKGVIFRITPENNTLIIDFITN